ncbi:MAG: ribbon-helix-helix domain-containing protein [Pseudomonadota bacterium]
MKDNLSEILNEPVTKHSVNIAGHPTSISLEKSFWEALKEIAHTNNKSVAQLIGEIDDARSINLSSAIRLYVLHHLE